MGALSQLGLLLWKNYLVQRRQLLWTVFEILIPTLLSIIMVILRQQIISTTVPPTRFDPFSVTGSLRDLLASVDNQTIATPAFDPNTVLYAPDTAVTRSVMKTVHGRYEFGNFSINLTPYSSEDALVNALVVNFTEGGSRSVLLGGIVFDESFANGLNNDTIRYTIRLSNSRRNPGTITDPNKQKSAPFQVDKGWDTNYVYPRIEVSTGPRERMFAAGGKPGYWREGFLTLQRAVDIAITAHFLPDAVKQQLFQVDVQLQRFPYPAFIDNPFIPAFQRQFPVILLISLIMSVLYITRNVVQEKEQRLKEYMKVMGLSGWLHWTAHFITNFIKLAIAVAVITLILCIDIDGKKIVERSDPSLVFVYLLLYAACTVWYSFAVSAFFHSGNSAAAFGGIFWFALYIPYFFLQPRYGQLTMSTKITSCFALNTAVAWGAEIIGIFESHGVGLRWADLFESGVIGDTFSMAHVMLMLIVNLVIFVIITWYVEAINPGDQGVPLKPWFPLLPSYWYSRPFVQSSPTLFERDRVSSSVSGCDTVEGDPPGMQAQITIRNLGKVWTAGLLQRLFDKLRGKKTADRVVAVSDLSVRMFPGQVTALLGHNGAGKSTTMSMLCGLVAPTSGTAVICGFDIRDSLPAIRKHLGLCPQYNCLFDNLTVDEHLILFCKLKNRTLVQSEVNHLLTALGLVKKRKALSKTLSGGMKRKLSVAIALIGGSEIVMLDEPTSGMDPGARHEAWTLLQEEKKRRTIMLTTHYMEEADLLGDRIAILARGRLQCCGSGLFLKNFYGTGYHLTMVFDKPNSPSTKRPMAQEALAVLQRSCKSAQLESAVGMEATFTLPYGDREKFEALFAELELNQSILGVASFGVSITTMEEVFLKVGHIADDNENGPAKASLVGGFQGLGSQSQSLEADAFSPADAGSNSSSSSTSSESIGLSPIASPKLVDLTVHASKYGAIDRSLCGQINDFDATFWTDSAIAEDEAACLIPPHEFRSARRLSGLALFWQQLYAMFVKRALHSARNWLVLFAQLVIPVFFVLMAIIINQTLPGPQELPPLSLNLRPFGSNVVSVQRRPGADGLIDGYESYIASTSDGTSFIDLSTSADFSSGVLDLYSSRGDFDVNRHYVLGVDANVSRDASGGVNRASIIGYFNNQPYHSPAIILNSVDNALIRLFTNSSSKSIETINHPLPPTSFEKLNDWLAAGVVEYNITFNLLFGFAFLASTFVVFLIKERETKAKHLQFLSGVHPANFWLATFLWDAVNYALPALAILLLWVIFGVTDLVDNGNWMTMLLLLATYGWATLPMMYAASFMFSSPASGFVKMTIFNIFSGLVTLTVNTILLLVGLEDTSRALDWVFLPLFPNYCLGDGIQVFYINEFVKRNCRQVEPYCDWVRNHTSTLLPTEITQCCYESNWVKDSLRWDYPGIGRMPVFMALQGVVFWFIVFLIEADVFRRARYALSDILRKRRNVENYSTFDDRQRMYQASGLPFGFSEDDDVVRERNRVSQLGTWTVGSDTAVLVVNDLVKNYGDVAAVRGLHFAVNQDECFGLLGVNGAGKTTTFRMLTGEELITAGSAIVSGINVKNDWRAAGPFVGYCPQFDAVIEQLTGTETLRMFARLRAIPASDIELLVEAVVRAVGIERHAARQVKTYSGGNKRRLSLGIALVGLPKVLLLDEPTTGVDPGARRAIWDILAQVRNQGTAIVLTSHSMEECEALCTRLAIMVDGQFKCFGSPQHLKSKYGSGFSLQLKVESLDMVETAKKAISANFPGCILKEMHYTQLAYELPSGQGSSWSRLFGAVEKLIEPLKIVDYSLSQTTLERVFLDFSRLAFDQSSTPYSPTASDGNSSGSVEFV